MRYAQFVQSRKNGFVIQGHMVIPTMFYLNWIILISIFDQFIYV